MKDRLLEKRNKDMPQIILMCCLGIALCVLASVVSIDLVHNEITDKTYALFLVTVLNAIIFGAYSASVYLELVYRNEDEPTC